MIQPEIKQWLAKSREGVLTPGSHSPAESAKLMASALRALVIPAAMPAPQAQAIQAKVVALAQVLDGLSGDEAVLIHRGRDIIRDWFRCIDATTRQLEHPDE